MRDDLLTIKAFKIADESMIGLLTGHAMKCDEFGKLWGLLSADGNEVFDLSEADPPLIEAIEWLLERNLCALLESPDGITILLKDGAFE